VAYQEQLEQELLQLKVTQSILKSTRPAASAPATRAGEQELERTLGSEQRHREQRGRGANPRGDQTVSQAVEQGPAAGLAAPGTSRSTAQGLPRSDSLGATLRMTPHSHLINSLVPAQQHSPGATVHVSPHSDLIVSLVPAQQQQHPVPVGLSQQGGAAELECVPCTSREGEASQTLREREGEARHIPGEHMAETNVSPEAGEAAACQSTGFNPALCLTPHCASCVQRLAASTLLLRALHWSLEVACSLGVRVLLWLRAMWRPREQNNAAAEDGRASATPPLPLALARAHEQMEAGPSGSPLAVIACGRAGREVEAAGEESSLRPSQSSAGDGGSLVPSQDSAGEAPEGQGLGPAAMMSVGQETHRRYAAGMPAGMPQEHERYWAQRYSLFALDAGVRMAKG